MPKYVRLKPYDKKEGNLLQRLTVRSKRMIAGRWYRVEDEFAKVLSEMRQPYPPGQTSSAKTPLAFDVSSTKKEAEKVERESKPKDPVESADDLTTGDLKATDLVKDKGKADDDSSSGSSSGSRRRSGRSSK